MPFLSKNAEECSLIAYFTMEVALESAMPTYSGGLGVLAGDTLRAAADAGVPMVAVTLLYRKGYFHQRLSPDGTQIEEASDWTPESFLTPLEPRAWVTVEGRKVHIRAWRYLVSGLRGHQVPVYFLDTALPENSPWDQTLTDHLYGGDSHYRLCQEVVLGIGGIAMLRALGCASVQSYHMNEGHSALLTLALLEERSGGRGLPSVTQRDMEAVQSRCVFTTHTPVAAGHDQFPLDVAWRVLGEERFKALEQLQCFSNGTLHMTRLALAFSRYVNGVSLQHQEVSQRMFPEHSVDAISNGVHAVTWTSPPYQQLYDRYIPEWRQDNRYLRYAVKIPLPEIRQAHLQAKRVLIDEVSRRTGPHLDPSAFTIGFARRAVPYKRADLLFSDIPRLQRIAQEVGPIQLIYAGKAHRGDEGGKALIRRVVGAAAALAGTIPLVYLEEYNTDLAKLVCAGVDLWLNTPQKPLEASGTSGMKAALNGVPSFSVLDGWWIEGHVEGATGWAIGNHDEHEGRVQELEDLYGKLEYLILPMFYQRPLAYAEVMRSAISLNGSFFTAQRMLDQYLENAYLASREEV
jgi:starch phosphorylase